MTKPQALIAYFVLLPQDSFKILDENSGCLCHNSSLERAKGAKVVLGRLGYLKVCKSIFQTLCT